MSVKDCLQACMQCPRSNKLVHIARQCLQVQKPEELWGNSFGRSGRGTAGSGGSHSAGQVCASILVKLMIDMYLKAGPAVAYPLSLLMLQRCDTNSAGP